MSWEPVIGLEIHVQLKTRTKMFCRCENGFGGAPNTQTCPVCLAFPGALPVAEPRGDRGDDPARTRARLRDRRARGLPPQELLLSRPAQGLPDLPVRRAALPRRRLVVPTETGHRGRHRARHLEEDAAKNVHVAASGRIHGATATLVDFNRGGTPLLEIVTAPDLHSAEHAKRFLQLLRQTVVELGLSDAELEKGSMRFDVNVSVRPAGSDELRTRTELKNMNSFNFAAKGIEREIARQIAIYEAGGAVEQETLHFDPGEALTAAALQGGGAGLPLLPRARPRPDRAHARRSSSRSARRFDELPGARIERIERELGVSADRARLLAFRGELGDFFERALAAGTGAATASSSPTGSATRCWRGSATAIPPRPRVTPAAFAALVEMVAARTVTATAARRSSTCSWRRAGIRRPSSPRAASARSTTTTRSRRSSRA